MHARFIPQFLRILKNVDHWLDKAQSFADAKKIDVQVLLDSRLAPDQFALIKQTQILSDIAKGAVARLTGQEAPKFADEEKTLADVRERLKKTASYLQSVKPDAFAGAEKRLVPIAAVKGKALLGEDYLVQWAIPNFYFHATTAYAILRHNGVELGKADFPGRRQFARSLIETPRLWSGEAAIEREFSN